MRAIDIMAKEPRLLELQSPIHIFGDIHGNWTDLSFFRDHCWPLGMGLTAGKFLFLGDYVDRGMCGIEVVTYLLAQKVALPNKVFLIRGNHECRSVNGWEQYYGTGSFLTQCKKSYGPELGQRVWEMINKVFDYMPLAATIDDKVFAAHGGIPRPIEGMSIDRLEIIRNLPCPIGVRPPSANESLESNNTAVDLLWADPADAEQEKLVGDSGFGEGSRGAGAICYGKKAIEDFLNFYKFNFIIRAHEATARGISISKSARLITVFSTSKDHGCGDGASCGCVLIENNNLMAINRITTGSLATPRAAPSFDGHDSTATMPTSKEKGGLSIRVNKGIPSERERASAESSDYGSVDGSESPLAPPADTDAFTVPPVKVKSTITSPLPDDKIGKV